MSIKINTLQIENIKRVKAVALNPAENGLTVIGGKNGQGKTSVLDAIAWALGGDRYRPSNPEREGSTLPPHIKLTLSNGLTVERSGKNSALKVVDTTGKRSGQQLLNEFVEQLAIDLPRFLQASNREKADTLLQVIGVGDRIHELEAKERDVYNRRRMIGQDADRKRKYADELPFYPAAPKELVSAMDLIRQQQDILARNGENQRKRMRANQIEHEYGKAAAHVSLLKSQLAAAQKQLMQLEADLEIAQKDALDLQDESTEAVEHSLQEIEQINIQVRANCDREKAEQDAAYYAQQYQELTAELEDIRHDKYALFNSAELPLPGLSVEDSELTYNGKKWDCMSGADQLIAATAVVRAVNPKCGFVLLDKLEQLDADTLLNFGSWLEEQGLQAIATRVSTGPECSIIIEDGFAAPEQPASATTAGWKKGVF
nr:MAG TPA: STRUCTURAL MAINTENANCE OF CHROMOSOMES PROTEIN [Caudoviricetes sp.]